MFYGVGSTWKADTNLAGNVAGHAAVGCISASMSGGNCGSGALSAGIADYAANNMPGAFNANIAAQTAYVAIVGGTTSVIAGGKFENGAQTAAFGYLFNELMHGGYRNGPDDADTRLRQGGFKETNNGDGTYCNIQGSPACGFPGSNAPPTTLVAVTLGLTTSVLDGALSVDTSGSVYFSPGRTLLPGEIPAVSLKLQTGSGNWTAQDKYDFMTGPSYSASGGYGLVGGKTWSPNGPGSFRSTTDAGISTPGVSLSGSVGFCILNCRK
jgi:hypothetical protein